VGNVNRESSRAEGTAEWLEADTELESSRRPELGETRVPGLTILYHPVLERIGERAALSEPEGGGTRISRLEPAFSQPGKAHRRPLAHPRLSRSPIAVGRGEAPGSLFLDASQTRTSVVVEGEPLATGRELGEEKLERGVVLLLGGEVVVLLHLLDPLSASAPRHDLVGESPAMVRLRREIERVADLDVPVLIRGETGTGKELVARALHRASPRREGPFVALNMAAVPPTLAAAELFGAKKGAFTGAESARQGHFRRARGGTLFLDEIGETPNEVQALLLRALESRTVQPLGGGEAEPIDVRLVSATDADLEGAIEGGSFRGPLLHRLAGFTLRTPPLRERREDIGRLFLHSLCRELETIGESWRLEASARTWIPASLVARLALHSWPGNVRQLQNVVRQLVISHRGAERIPAEPAILNEILGQPVESARPSVVRATAKGPRKPAEIREDELLSALRANRFRLQATADHLGIPRSSLYELIEKSPRVRKASELSHEEIEESLERAGGSVERAAEELEVSERALRRRMGRLGVGD